MADTDIVANMDEAVAAHLKMHAGAQEAEAARREAEEQTREAEQAGRKKLIEQMRGQQFQHALDFLLQMSRWHADVLSERQAVTRAAEAEANERDYERDRDRTQHGYW